LREGRHLHLSSLAARDEGAGAVRKILGRKIEEFFHDVWVVLKEGGREGGRERGEEG